MSLPRLILPDSEKDTVEAGVLGVGLWQKLIASLKLLGGGSRKQVIEYKGYEVTVEALRQGTQDLGRVRVEGGALVTFYSSGGGVFVCKKGAVRRVSVDSNGAFSVKLTPSLNVSWSINTLPKLQAMLGYSRHLWSDKMPLVAVRSQNTGALISDVFEIHTGQGIYPTTSTFVATKHLSSAAQVGGADAQVGVSFVALDISTNSSLSLIPVTVIVKSCTNGVTAVLAMDFGGFNWQITAPAKSGWDGAAKEWAHAYDGGTLSTSDSRVRVIIPAMTFKLNYADRTADMSAHLEALYSSGRLIDSKGSRVSLFEVALSGLIKASQRVMSETGTAENVPFGNATDGGWSKRRVETRVIAPTNRLPVMLQRISESEWNRDAYSPTNSDISSPSYGQGVHVTYDTTHLATYQRESKLWYVDKNGGFTDTLVPQKIILKVEVQGTTLGSVIVEDSVYSGGVDVFGGEYVFADYKREYLGAERMSTNVTSRNGWPLNGAAFPEIGFHVDRSVVSLKGGNALLGSAPPKPDESLTPVHWSYAAYKIHSRHDVGSYDAFHDEHGNYLSIHINEVDNSTGHSEDFTFNEVAENPLWGGYRVASGVDLGEMPVAIFVYPSINKTHLCCFHVGCGLAFLREIQAGNRASVPLSASTFTTRANGAIAAYNQKTAAAKAQADSVGRGAADYSSAINMYSAFANLAAASNDRDWIVERDELVAQHIPNQLRLLFSTGDASALYDIVDAPGLWVAGPAWRH